MSKDVKEEAGCDASAVTFVDGVARPAVEGVELRHRRSKLRQVFTIHAGVAETGREQARRLGSQF